MSPCTPISTSSQSTQTDTPPANSTRRRASSSSPHSSLCSSGSVSLSGAISTLNARRASRTSEGSAPGETHSISRVSEKVIGPPKQGTQRVVLCDSLAVIMDAMLVMLGFLIFAVGLLVFLLGGLAVKQQRLEHRVQTLEGRLPTQQKDPHSTNSSPA